MGCVLLRQEVVMFQFHWIRSITWPLRNYLVKNLRMPAQLCLPDTSIWLLVVYHRLVLWLCLWLLCLWETDVPFVILGALLLGDFVLLVSYGLMLLFACVIVAILLLAHLALGFGWTLLLNLAGVLSRRSAMVIITSVQLVLVRDHDVISLRWLGVLFQWIIQMRRILLAWLNIWRDLKRVFALVTPGWDLKADNILLRVNVGINALLYHFVH